MKWLRYTLSTTTEAVDIVSATLNEFGIEGIEVEDKIPLTEEEKAKLFIDILPELGEDDGIAYVHFYVEKDVEPEILDNIKAELEDMRAFCNMGSLDIELKVTEDKDWINNWKEFFKPFHLEDNIVIKPTWEQYNPANEKELVIEIDPGTAFGTGSHETTKLCVSAINKYLKSGMTLLDVGCGSGILSIIGEKLGGRDIIGIDVDENAVRVSIENAEVNKCHDIKFMQGNVIDNSELRKDIGLHKYDIVVANILADIIIPLSDVAEDFMKRDSLFISSGIINTKAEQVKEALRNNNFDIVDEVHMGDWVSIVAKIHA